MQMTAAESTTNRPAPHGDIPSRGQSPSTTAAWRAVGTMAWREIIRFLRQRNRVIGAVGQPLLFWLLFGAGMNQTFQVPGQPFREYFVPGVVVLILLFTAIFATISVIEDRQEGFLQAVLVAPVPRWSFVLGKVLGGSVLAVGQGLLFLLLAITFHVSMTVGTAVTATAFMTLIAIGLTCLGFCLAWRLDSTQGFHAIMNLLLMPMWLLSGAFFPVPERSPTASFGEHLLHWIMRVNPVTYAVSGLRQILGSVATKSSATASDAIATGTTLFSPALGWCWAVTAGFAIAMLWLANRVARSSTQGDLR
jgi:ABC-2 type transport system permease protein